MKHVVIVGADFTPSSYPPALRIRFFAQHLPKFGWQPTVVTTDPQYYEWSVDPENDRLLSETVRVVRTRAFSARLTRKLGIGDVGTRSLWHHWKAVRALCQSECVDLIFIPVPPYLPAILGRIFHRCYSVPYVIDYIDPWIVSDWRDRRRREKPPLKRRVAHALSCSLEPFALRRVGHIVGVSKGTTDSVIARYPWLNKADATEIPYGGEPSDFDYAKRHPRRNETFDCRDGFLHLSYVGRGGPDLRPAVKAVLEGVKLGLQRSPELFRRLRMHFVGSSYDPKGGTFYQVLPLAREVGIEEYVKERPARISYLDAIQILLDSHALLVIGPDAPHYTASKIFPYMLARKPMLAVLHQESSAVSILRETGAGVIVTFSCAESLSEKVTEISTHLETLLASPQGDHTQTRWDAFSRYHAHAMAARLAQVFNKVTDCHPSR